MSLISEIMQKLVGPALETQERDAQEQQGVQGTVEIFSQEADFRTFKGKVAMSECLSIWLKEEWEEGWRQDSFVIALLTEISLIIQVSFLLWWQNGIKRKVGGERGGRHTEGILSRAA